MTEQNETQQVSITLGDLQVCSSKNSLKDCLKIVKSVLKNSDMKDYLKVDVPVKKLNSLISS